MTLVTQKQLPLFYVGPARTLRTRKTKKVVIDIMEFIPETTPVNPLSRTRSGALIEARLADPPVIPLTLAVLFMVAIMNLFSLPTITAEWRTMPCGQVLLLLFLRDPLVIGLFARVDLPTRRLP